MAMVAHHTGKAPPIYTDVEKIFTCKDKECVKDTVERQTAAD
jgi:hypothetical protein